MALLGVTTDDLKCTLGNEIGNSLNGSATQVAYFRFGKALYAAEKCCTVFPYNTKHAII
jgi:hypothetical protein